MHGKAIQSTHICLFDICKVDPEKNGGLFLIAWKFYPTAFPFCGVELIYYIYQKSLPPSQVKFY